MPGIAVGSARSRMTLADSKLFDVRSLATSVVGLDLAEAALGMHSVGK
jgi:hypothetical protein